MGKLVSRWKGIVEKNVGERGDEDGDLMPVHPT